MSKARFAIALSLLYGHLLAAQPPSSSPAAVDSATPVSNAIADSPDTTQSPVQAKPRPRMFATGQFDSILSLLPSGDSLRAAGGIAGIGLDTVSGSIIVVSFDDRSNPVKTSFPAPAQKQKAATTVPGATSFPYVKVTAKPKLVQNGRTWFIIESTLKSVFTYPSAYGTILANDSGSNDQVIGGASLLTIGGTLYGAFAFTKGMELGYGKVALMNFGSTMLGNYYPMLMSSFLHNATSINDSYKTHEYATGPVVYDGPTATDHIGAWSSIAGFPLGIYLGSRWNIVGKDDYGKAAVMAYFSQTLGALAFTLPAFYYDRPLGEDKRKYLIASTALSMGLLPAGFYAGYKLTQNKTVSAGRGTLPWVTGSMGALTGLGLASLSDKDYGIAGWRILWASGIAGYGAGTYLGFAYHPETEYLFWQSVFIGAAAASGAAIGEAFPLLAKANNKRAYIVAAVTGGWTGFYFGEKLSLSLFEKTGRDNRVSNLGISLPGLAALPMLAARNRAKVARHEGAAVPLAIVDWRF